MMKDASHRLFDRDLSEPLYDGTAREIKSNKAKRRMEKTSVRQ